MIMFILCCLLHMYIYPIYSTSVWLIHAVSTNMVIDESPFAYHSVAFNPMDPQLLVSANENSGASLFDIRQSQR